MDEYVVSFRGMSGDSPNLIITPSEMDFLLSENLIRVQGEKIRTVLIERLADYHSNRPSVNDESLPLS